MTAAPGGRRLVLLRHAKAETGQADALRPLSLTGRAQCADVGHALRASGLAPDRVLVSSALRTRQTWELVRVALGEVVDAEVEVTDRLYGAAPSDVLELVRAVGAAASTVLVVGHEPTTSSTAAVLVRVGSGPEHALASVRTGLPTAGYAVLGVEDWAALDRGTAQLLDVVRPPR